MLRLVAFVRMFSDKQLAGLDGSLSALIRPPTRAGVRLTITAYTPSSTGRAPNQVTYDIEGASVKEVMEQLIELTKMIDPLDWSEEEAETSTEDAITGTPPIPDEALEIIEGSQSHYNPEEN